jgi:hypothetical protein
LFALGWRQHLRLPQPSGYVFALALLPYNRRYEPKPAKTAVAMVCIQPARVLSPLDGILFVARLERQSRSAEKGNTRGRSG